MPLRTLAPLSAQTLTLSSLSPSNFSPFGTCITPPLPPTTNTIPTSIPTPLQPRHQVEPIYANQNTALKTAPTSPLTNSYPPESSSKPESKPLMSMFSCFPRQLSSSQFAVTILERHPYTTQTFCPLGLSADARDTMFLVIVAPTSSGEVVKGLRNPPDLGNVKAFIAKGDQAITYGPGTWHAPMVVLGKKRVDFVVTQFVNGVPEDDCQEVLVRDVTVDLNGLGVTRAIKARL